ncbi:MAG: histidine phosphatase family protein [bacterium]|nr:histidine phosphatase family protein [bacterium]
MKTTIVLVRHGQTTWNKEHRFQGQTDVPLSEEGIRQAELLAKKIKDFKITKVCTSKLKRAYHTAEILTENLNLAIEKIKDFNERNYGECEGKLWNDIKDIYKENMEEFFEKTPKGGESQINFRKRVIATFNKIIGQYKGEKVLMVCHGGVINILVHHLSNAPEEKLVGKRYPNTCVSIFHIEEDKVTEEIIADISHLT